MIYVLESSAQKIFENGKKELYTIYKVGYTKDGTENHRFRTYVYCNPTIAIKLTIPKCTLSEEQALHYHLRYVEKVKTCDSLREWYADDRVVSIIQDLGREGISKLNLPPRRDDPQLRLLKKELKPFLDFALADKVLKKSSSKVFKEESSNLLVKYDMEYLLKNLNTVLSSVYGEEMVDKFNEFVSKRNKVLSEEGDLGELFRSFENCKDYYEKMKLVCTIDHDKAEKLLELLPDSNRVKYHYKFFGSEKCKNLGYNVTRITRELSRIVAPDKEDKLTRMIEEIYSTFIVGSRYRFIDIKASLKAIYERFDYPNNPHATDLKEYFNLKICDMYPKENGETVHYRGFIILSKLV